MSSGLELLKEGCVVMCIGMGMVITFLTIMVFSIEIMHIIIEKLNKIFPPEIKEEVKKVAKAKKFKTNLMRLLCQKGFKKKSKFTALAVLDYALTVR